MNQSFGTKTVHTHLNISGRFQSKTTPIYQTSAFVFDNLRHLESFYKGETPYLYTRTGNPNPDELGQAVANLENAPKGIASSSGLSAILAGVLSVAKSGDHIVAAEDVYGGTHHLLKRELEHFGIHTTFVPFQGEEAIKEAIRPETKLIFTETVTNPFLRVENLTFVAKLAKERGLTSMVDNTFATPYLLNPYERGIDLVVHSATKYIGGHSDVTAGVLVGREDLIEAARERVVNLGWNVSPFEAWLTVRGLKTLAVRMEKQCANAETLAAFFRNNGAVRRVYYPAFVSEKGNGAMVTIELASHVDVERFFESLDWIKIVPTLAGVETTVSYPIGTSHRALEKEEQEKLGINERVVRISVGIEEINDIIDAFQLALDRSASKGV